MMLQTRIDKIVYPGKSLSSGEGKVILTDEGLPGEIVSLKVVQEKKNYIECQTTAVLNTSPHRTEPRCSHYRACSPYQYMDYKFQIEVKKAQVREIFQHELGLELKDAPFLASPKIWGYRNRIRLSLIRKERRVFYAYHRPGSLAEFVPVDACFLIPPKMNDLLASILELVQTNEWDMIEDVEARESSASQNFLVILHTKSLKKLKEIGEDFSGLASRFPLGGIVGLGKPKKGNEEILMAGKNFLEEKAGGLAFLIGPQSFFQINKDMLEQVIQDLKDFLGLSGRERIADLYCGLGTFGMALAPQALEVYEVESFPENIAFLKKNLSLNKIGNLTVCEGTSQEWISWILKKGIDVVIVNPPRKGLSPSLVKSLLRRPVPQMAYLSCNPMTLVRDLKQLLTAYSLKSLRVYDFFPHTPHIEILAVLKKPAVLNSTPFRRAGRRRLGCLLL